MKSKLEKAKKQLEIFKKEVNKKKYFGSKSNNKTK